MHGKKTLTAPFSLLEIIILTPFFCTGFFSLYLFERFSQNLKFKLNKAYLDLVFGKKILLKIVFRGILTVGITEREEKSHSKRKLLVGVCLLVGGLRCVQMGFFFFFGWKNHFLNTSLCCYLRGCVESRLMNSQSSPERQHVFVTARILPFSCITFPHWGSTFQQQKINACV